MTDITPPPELVSKWCYEDGEEIKSSPRWFFSVCAKAAQYGADQELEACCEWIAAYPWLDHPELLIKQLRAARRPKPPNLKEQALHELAGVYNRDGIDDAAYDIIRRALEQLDD